MGRFKYIPQRYENIYDENGNLIKNESLIDSEPLDISIVDIDGLDDTMIVYDDYKIPINITETLLYNLQITQTRIEEIYDKMNKINKNLEEATLYYNLFEDRVFGKRTYIYDHNTQVFRHGYTEYDIDSVKDNGEFEYLIEDDKISVSVDSEVKDVLTTKEILKYNSNLISIERDIISLINNKSSINTLETQLDKYIVNYNMVKWNWRDKKEMWTIEYNDNINKEDKNISDINTGLDNMFGNEENNIKAVHMVDNLKITFDDGTEKLVAIEDGDN